MESLKFVPFCSSLHPGFWTELTKYKLEVLGLVEDPVDVCGAYSISDPPGGGLLPRVSIEWNALKPDQETSWNHFLVKGKITLKNTVEAFKSEDKISFLKSEAEKMWDAIITGSWIENPDVLTSFSILMYADLKKYMFYYWFAFPAFNVLSGVKLGCCQQVGEVLSKDQLAILSNSLREGINEAFSIILLQENSLKVVQFNTIKTLEDKTMFMICIADPSSMANHPGWPVRNLVTALCYEYPDLISGLKLLCLRASIKDGKVDLGHSLVMTLAGTITKLSENPGVVGWEKNDKGQMGPKLANMRSSMDPSKLAEGSVDLNLKLMKWRLVPDLNLEKIMKSTCLLLGSGTLGCGVARALLGWGVRHITFVDNGKVSFSNPVRQSLFQFEDCLSGGKPKAVAAAERLKQIFPGVTTQGHELSIPMPGHPVSPATESAVREAYGKLYKLIEDHQIIFLLMDSRESRWLPTVMASQYPEKLVINAALGFDSYLVMRHGIRQNGVSVPKVTGVLSGEELGCYFCNDVVAPGDSTTDRTLDQQCTVTRPGASGIASSLAVELAMSCFVHPQGSSAPAAISVSGDMKDVKESVLGTVPHTIRGSLHNFSQVCPTGPVFSQCTACSSKVSEMLTSDGFEFIRKVGDNPKFLEDITGLTELMCDNDLMSGVLDLADDDEFSLSSDDMMD